MKDFFSAYLGEGNDINLMKCLSPSTVFVREIKFKDLVSFGINVDTSKEEFSEGDLIYVAFDQNGKRVAMADDRKLVFLAARHLDCIPVSTH